MKATLSQEEKDKIMNTLSEEKQLFLRNKLKRGYRTAFANEMARMKGMILPVDADLEEVEQLLEEWVLVDFIDSGFVSEDTLCECGRPLRYQYTVEHVSSGRIMKFGKNHLEQHTGLDPQVVRDIIKGFGVIDYELEEMLGKINSGWTLEDELARLLLPTDLSLISIPADIQAHLDLQLPLLDRQTMRIKRLMLEKVEQTNKERRQQELEARSKASEASNREARDTYTDFQMNLFAEVPEKLTRKSERVDGELPQWMKEKILYYLEVKQIFSARIICELLIKQEQAPAERYVTGKPKIYFPVCVFMDSLQHYQLLEGDHEDRKYVSLKETLV